MVSKFIEAALAREDNRPTLTFAYAADGLLYSADGFRLHVEKTDAADGFIPTKYSPTIPDAAAKYPDASSILNSHDQKYTVTVRTDELRQAVTLAEIFSRDLSYSTRFAVAGSTLSVFGRSPERGDCETAVWCDNPDAACFMVSYNARFILDICKTIDADAITLSIGSDGRLLVSNPDMSRMALFMAMTQNHAPVDLTYDFPRTVTAREEYWPVASKLPKARKSASKRKSKRAEGTVTELPDGATISILDHKRDRLAEVWSQETGRDYRASLPYMFSRAENMFWVDQDTAHLWTASYDQKLYNVHILKFYPDHAEIEYWHRTYGADYTEKQKVAAARIHGTEREILAAVERFAKWPPMADAPPPWAILASRVGQEYAAASAS